MFITFEGIDGSGKTTLATKFVNYLKNNNYGVILTTEPTRLVIGKFVRDLLALNTKNLPLEIYGLLLAADRIHHIETVIKPELKNNRIVVSDRYVGSAYAYNVYDSIDIVYKNIPKPDVTYYIDITTEVAEERRIKRGLSKDVLENNLDIVLERYKNIAKENDYVVIDGNRELDLVYSDIISHFLLNVESRIKQSWLTFNSR